MQRRCATALHYVARLPPSVFGGRNAHLEVTVVTSSRGGARRDKRCSTPCPIFFQQVAPSPHATSCGSRRLLAAIAENDGRGFAHGDGVSGDAIAGVRDEIAADAASGHHQAIHVARDQGTQGNIVRLHLDAGIAVGGRLVCSPLIAWNPRGKWAGRRRRRNGRR